MVSWCDELDRATTGHHWGGVHKELLLAHQQARGAWTTKELVARDEDGIFSQHALQHVTRVMRGRN